MDIIAPDMDIIIASGLDALENVISLRQKILGNPTVISLFFSNENESGDIPARLSFTSSKLRMKISGELLGHRGYGMDLIRQKMALISVMGGKADIKIGSIFEMSGDYVNATSYYCQGVERVQNAAKDMLNAITVFGYFDDSNEIQRMSTAESFNADPNVGDAPTKFVGLIKTLHQLTPSAFAVAMTKPQEYPSHRDSVLAASSSSSSNALFSLASAKLRSSTTISSTSTLTSSATLNSTSLEQDQNLAIYIRSPSIFHPVITPALRSTCFFASSLFSFSADAMAFATFTLQASGFHQTVRPYSNISPSHTNSSFPLHPSLTNDPVVVSHPMMRPTSSVSTSHPMMRAGSSVSLSHPMMRTGSSVSLSHPMMRTGSSLSISSQSNLPASASLIQQLQPPSSKSTCRVHKDLLNASASLHAFTLGLCDACLWNEFLSFNSSINPDADIVGGRLAIEFRSSHSDALFSARLTNSSFSSSSSSSKAYANDSVWWNNNITPIQDIIGGSRANGDGNRKKKKTLTYPCIHYNWFI